MKKLWNWIRSLFGWKPAPAPIPTPQPGPEPTPGAPLPVKLPHGAKCHVPMQDKSNRDHGAEKIHRVGPFNDFRVLEIGDDAFLDDFILEAVRVENDHICADDLEHSGVIYAFDHWSIKTSSNKTLTNPLPLSGVSKDTFRTWWNCYAKLPI